MSGTHATNPSSTGTASTGTSSTGTSSTAGSASSGERTAAVVLWVVVGAGLAYGVVETAARVTQLFG